MASDDSRLLPHLLTLLTLLTSTPSTPSTPSSPFPPHGTVPCPPLVTPPPQPRPPSAARPLLERASSRAARLRAALAVDTLRRASRPRPCAARTAASRPPLPGAALRSDADQRAASRLLLAHVPSPRSPMLSHGHPGPPRTSHALPWPPMTSSALPFSPTATQNLLWSPMFSRGHLGPPMPSCVLR